MQESGQIIHMPKMTPDWTFERKAKKLAQNKNIAICGVDEAGRGPLAGPVVACAVILNPQNYPSGLNDSKTLSKKRRDALYAEILQLAEVGIGIAEPEEIDRLNILHASLRAMQRAICDLAHMPGHALIDGNHAPPARPDMALIYEPIIKGDGRSLSIAGASIIAKVKRDRIMQEAALRFPGYGFGQHKGYPTRQHLEALARLGPCPIHRFSFAPVQAAKSAR